MRRQLALASALCGALLLSASRTFACGVSASGVASCSLAEHDAAVRPRWALGVNALYTSTRLRFSGSLRGTETRYATQASLAYLPTEKLVLQAGLGATFGGELVVGGERYQFSTGSLASLGADYRLIQAGPWFAFATSLLSFSATRTRLGTEPTVGYQAFDLRLGGELGLELLRIVRPYALARLFGGPVLWRYRGASVTGTDTHHYQLGLGLGLAFAPRLSASLEAVPLGERALSLGLAAAF